MMKTLRMLWMAALALISVALSAYGLESMSAQQTNRLLIAQSDLPTDPINTGAGDSNQFDFGILWQIDNGFSTPSFVLGTMHVEDTRVTTLPTAVQQVFENSDSLTTEALLELEQILLIGPELLLIDGSTLEGLIGAELYAEVGDALRARGMMPEMASLLKPWAVALLLSQPHSQSGMFLDRKLYQLAKQSDKAVYGLETLAEQLSVFRSMDLTDQITLLEETLAQLNLIPEIIERLTQAYLARDLKQLTTIANEQFSSSPVQQQLKQQLVVDRNQKMVARMQPRIKEGNAFIAIGALHLPGQSGILSLLQQMGYTVSRVY